MHFQAEIKGEIQIKFRREKIGECINHREESKIENYKSNSFILIVSDDGVGVPENLGIGDIKARIPAGSFPYGSVRVRWGT